MPCVSIEKLLQGSSVAPGIAIGTLCVLRHQKKEISKRSLSKEEAKEEALRYRKALKEAAEEIKFLKNSLKKEKVEEAVEILDTHLALLKDPHLSKGIEKQIIALRMNAEHVFQTMIEQCQMQFLSMPDPYLRERHFDIEDISQRILSHLTNDKRKITDQLPENAIVYAHELTPSMVAEASLERIKAFITSSGSTTSHAAIVARSKGIAFISSIQFEDIQEAVGEQVIAEGNLGDLILFPTQETLEKVRRKIKRLKKETSNLNDFCSLQAETLDGEKIQLYANVDVDDELEMLNHYGGEGVGLYRSEFAFLDRDTLPTEEEQYQVYRRIIQKLAGLPIVIRTFDIGGDKAAQYPYFAREGHPFLGFRAIRFLLKEKELFRAQIRAILRASQGADVSILFPMVSSLTELREAKLLVEEMKKELKEQKIPFSKKVKLGSMIEVPSAAIIADLLANECDFFSIGTNDLVQYSLAVDRSDHSLSCYYTPTHPGILRLIKITINAGQNANIPVSICGEIAADPKFVPLLLGLGVRALSVAARYLSIIKQTIRSIDLKQAKKLAQKALKCATSQEIEQLLEK